MPDTKDIVDFSTELLEDVPIGRIVQTIWNKMAEKRLTDLFETCAAQIGSTGKLDEKFKTKLNKFLSSKSGQEITFTLISKALSSDSERCCRVLGVILGRKMLNDDGFDYRDRIIANALQAMSDGDLELLIAVCDSIDQMAAPPEIIDKTKGDENELRSELLTNSVHIQDFHDHNLIGGDVQEHLYSIEHMKSLGILTSTALYEGSMMSGTEGLLKPNKLSYIVMDLAKSIE